MINKVLKERADNVKSYLMFQILDWAQDTIPRLLKHYCTTSLTLACDTDEEVEDLVNFLEVVDTLPTTRRFGAISVTSSDMKTRRIADAGGLASRVFRVNDRWYFGYPVTKWSAYRRTFNAFNFKPNGDDGGYSPSAMARSSGSLQSYVVLTLKKSDAFTRLLEAAEQLKVEKERIRAEKASKMKESSSKRNGQQMMAAVLDTDGQSWKGKKIYCRDLSSVTMSPETYRNVFANTMKWIGKRDLYMSSGIPHKRVILLYGPPGMGKTSLAKALATETEYSLHIGDLNDHTTKEGLDAMVRTAGAGSIVLFDDFDTIKAFRRDYKPDALSGFSGKADGFDMGEGLPRGRGQTPLRLKDILNIFDGVDGLDSQIVILTTNDISGIDPAFLRKGRVDVIVKVDYFTHDEVCMYVNQRFPDAVIPEGIRFGQISGADLQSIFLRDDNDESAERFINAIPQEGSPQSLALIKSYETGVPVFDSEEDQLTPVIEDGAPLEKEKAPAE